MIVSNVKEASEALEKIYNISDGLCQELSLNARKCYKENFHSDVI